MNPDFYSKISIVNHERSVIPSSVKFSVHKHENFPPQLRRRKRWVKNWKKRQWPEKKYCPLEINENCYLDPA